MKKKGTLYLVQMALLVAIIILMAFTPIGYIRMPGVEITLIVVPVAVGAVLMGPAGGAILGGVFGITSFIQCFGMSAFGAQLLAINPILTFLVCVPTRILAGWIGGLLFAGLKKKRLTHQVEDGEGKVVYKVYRVYWKNLPYYAANLACPICNTIFFTATLCLFFFQTDYIQSLAGGRNVLAFVAFFVGFNGLVEAIACFVVGTAISRILAQVLRNTSVSAV